MSETDVMRITERTMRELQIAQARCQIAGNIPEGRADVAAVLRRALAEMERATRGVL